MKGGTLPDFSGKLVYVRLLGVGYTFALNCPKWQVQGGRLFLVGTVPPKASARDWCVGQTSGIAWDQVTDYVVFDSVERYRQRVRIFDRDKGKA